MDIRETPDSFTNDLILEILSRLPAKSIARFRCVSKLWESILTHPDVPKLFLTMSMTRPRLLLAIKEDIKERGKVVSDWSFYSSPQPHNLKSSIVVSADFHMKFRQDMSPEFRSLTSGLIYFRHILVSKKDKDTVPMICNPSTGRFATLPSLITYGKLMSFLGFDPIGKQYKVLLIVGYGRDSHRILTIGSGEMSWRKIKCSLTHERFGNLELGICINGGLYYLADQNDETSDYETSLVIVCFDVRSEKFKFIEAKGFSSPFSFQLINYKGKLGRITKEYVRTGTSLAIQLRMRVLEDIEKEEWSEYVYTLPENKSIKPYNVYVAGVTSTGEIVLSDYRASKQFYVYYFNPERSTLQTVEIHGNHQVFDKPNRVYVFVDHVEDLQFQIAKTYAVTSISPPEQKQ